MHYMFSDASLDGAPGSNLYQRTTPLEQASGFTVHLTDALSDPWASLIKVPYKYRDFVTSYNKKNHIAVSIDKSRRDNKSLLLKV